MALAIFGYLGPTSKSIFSTYKQNFANFLVMLVVEFAGNNMLSF